jgi:hypothetical protein
MLAMGFCAAFARSSVLSCANPVKDKKEQITAIDTMNLIAFII